MKTFKQTSEIIDYGRLFHERMKDFYIQLHEKAEKQRVKMLLEYLSQHENHREETLAKYKKEASNKVMDTWFQYIHENIPSDFFENIKVESNMSVDDVVNSALQLNNCLIELYKGLIEETKVEEIRDLFKSLVKRLEQEERDLVRDASRLNEI